jgi:CheY-like chemotaxis protein
VFGVVKQSGGGIYVYSEPGSGTTFKIYLPAAAGRTPEPRAEVAPATGTETVLVVEDDANVRDLVRLLLEHSGYTVLTAQDAEEAVRACTELGVHLLLTDVVMPEVSGQALAERVAAAAPDVRILFMSGYSDDAVQRQGLLGERSAFIEKPFTERALTTKVREVLDAA